MLMLLCTAVSQMDMLRLQYSQVRSARSYTSAHISAAVFCGRQLPAIYDPSNRVGIIDDRACDTIPALDASSCVRDVAQTQLRRTSTSLEGIYKPREVPPLLHGMCCCIHHCAGGGTPEAGVLASASFSSEFCDGISRQSNSIVSSYRSCVDGDTSESC
ncbi:hypothetical protein FKP32DRAFT_880647 [Trametes sanguinea]|nr:hypothetical protein FKP32DRAFT_880647 [Trametes sanguinea]